MNGAAVMICDGWTKAKALRHWEGPDQWAPTLTVVEKLA